MSQHVDRRKFARRCAAAAAAAVCGNWKFDQLAHAIEPIVRNGSTKFKFSLAAYSYRDLLTGKSPDLTLADFIDDCGRMNLEGTELTSYYFAQPTTLEYLRKLKRQCFRLGLDVSGTAVGNDFGFPPGQQRDQQIAAVKQWIEFAEILGAPVIRIFAGKQKKNVSATDSYKLMIEGIEECCDYAGQHGIHLALENHGGPTATAEGMLSFIRDVRSPWFGVNLDTGNFFTDDPYGDLAKIAPYALNVQVKTVTADDEERRNKQPTDFARLAKILDQAEYRGYVALEYEEDGDPRTECPKHIDRIRAAFT